MFSISEMRGPAKISVPSIAGRANFRSARASVSSSRAASEQRHDLFGSVQICRLGATDLQEPPLASRWVPVDQFVLDRQIEDLPQPHDGLVDRLRRKSALADLRLAVTIHVGHRDLRERVVSKEGQQVIG
jgi:hypothetical protein